MDMFDFEELLADMFGVTDDQREDDNLLEAKLYEEFELDMDSAFDFAQKLLWHVPPVKAGISGKSYHAFVSKSEPIMLMKIAARN